MKWILVANKARAVVVEQRARGERPSIVATIEHPEGRLLDSELKSDRPGQTFDSRGVARNAMQSKESPVKHETRVYVRKLVRTLDKAAAKERFNELELVCPSELLGELRAALSPSIAERVTRETTRDIAKWTNAEILAAAVAT